MPTPALLLLLLVALTLLLVALAGGAAVRQYVLPAALGVIGLLVSALAAMWYVFPRIWPDGPTESSAAALYCRAAAIFLAVLSPFIAASAVLMRRCRGYPP